MDELKTFVQRNNTATVICPACNSAKKISAEPYRNKKHAIKVRCGCGETFNLRLDFRSQYRKLTNLPGTYSITTPGKAGGGVIHIQDISRGGIGFTVVGRHHLARNLVLKLEFTLDDKKQTKLRIKAIVSSVEGNEIGCHFPENTILERALAFYLQP